MIGGERRWRLACEREAGWKQRRIERDGFAEESLRRGLVTLRTAGEAEQEFGHALVFRVQVSLERS